MSTMLLGNAGNLVPHAVLASEDALNNLDHRLMLFGRLRAGSCFVVRGDDIGKQTAHVRFADDIEISSAPVGATRRCQVRPCPRHLGTVRCVAISFVPFDGEAIASHR